MILRVVVFLIPFFCADESTFSHFSCKVCHSSNFIYDLCTSINHCDGFTDLIWDFLGSGANNLMVHISNIKQVSHLRKIHPVNYRITFWSFGDEMFTIIPEEDEWLDSGILIKNPGPWWNNSFEELLVG
jgi:hypothetical protein